MQASELPAPARELYRRIVLRTRDGATITREALAKADGKKRMTDTDVTHLEYLIHFGLVEVVYVPRSNVLHYRAAKQNRSVS